MKKQFKLNFIIAPTCPALVQSMGTTVFPSTCLQDQVMEAGDLCKFSCTDGFELPDNEDTLICLATGNWNASIIYCKSKEYIRIYSFHSSLKKRFKLSYLFKAY